MIEIKNLSKNYNELNVLKDISFSVNDGEVLGFLGPNGAGKSTTMKIITGYTAPTSGAVYINGINIEDNFLKVKSQIGYLPESAPLYNDMTVYEYLNFVADIRLRQLQKHNEKKQALQSVIQVCGLSTVVHRLIGELSKGFRQRTCLAQALVHNPDILILDEPTSGLDPNQIAEIRNVIKRIGEKKTVILSTHILQEVQATCDRVIIINQGKIVASGTTEELERQAQGKQSIYVKVKGLQDKIHKLLLDLPEVSEIRKKDYEKEVQAFGFEIITKNNTDMREIVFRSIAQADMPILEMRQAKTSLEDIFRQLTK